MAAEKKPRGLSQFLQAQSAPQPVTSTSTERTRAGEAPAAGPRRATGKATGSSSVAANRRRTKEGKEQLLVYLRPEGIKQLKLAEIEDEYPSVSAIVAEAINEWLVKRKRPPVA